MMPVLKILEKKVNALARPVILLEGRRVVAEQDQPILTELAATLAVLWPMVRFRSGNAPGSDTLFAEGVAGVDPSRLEYVVPYAGHRKKQRFSNASVFSLDALSFENEAEIARHTMTASPQNRGGHQKPPQSTGFREKGHLPVKGHLEGHGESGFVRRGNRGVLLRGPGRCYERGDRSHHTGMQ